MRSPLIVLKFGGSVLGCPADLANAVHEVYRWTRRGWRVAAVVSAFQGTTDALLHTARALSSTPHPQADATLLATGELTTAAQLCLALTRAGLDSRLLTPHCFSFRTDPAAAPHDADPHSIDAAALRAALDRSPVVVVPGFIAASPDGSYSLLGRGGSDLTALFLAAQLHADRCRLIKDVEGLYDRDPNQPASAPTLDHTATTAQTQARAERDAIAPPAPPQKFRTVHWSRALALGGGILQPKAIRFAQQHKLAFEVGCFHHDDPTLVGDFEDIFDEPALHPLSLDATPRVSASPSAASAPLPIRPAHPTPPSYPPPPPLPLPLPHLTPQPLRVTLLGCGTVGAGVLAHLTTFPHLNVSAVLVKSPDRARRRFADALRALRARSDSDDPRTPQNIPPVPFVTDPARALAQADIVIDALPDVEPARTLLGLALSRGVPCVSANKALIADHADDLRAAARAPIASDDIAHEPNRTNATRRASDSPSPRTPSLLTSACVGGGTPMLESIARLRTHSTITAVEGVVSATANSVLDHLRLIPGSTLDDAVRHAQARGLAEPDPTRDLDSSDTRAKLRILCRAAFDAEPDAIRSVGVTDLRDPSLPRLLAQLPPGAALRLIARAEILPPPPGPAADEPADDNPLPRAGNTEQTPPRIVASVRLAVVLPGHPLHDVPADANRLVLTDHAGNSHLCSGIGAGRWPTAQSVIADVLDLVRDRAARDAAGATPRSLLCRAIDASGLPDAHAAHARPVGDDQQCPLSPGAPNPVPPIRLTDRAAVRARLLPSARLPCS